MRTTPDPRFQQLAERAGVIIPGAMEFLERMPKLAEDGKPIKGQWGDWNEAAVQLAMDAVTATSYNQPTLVTAPNASIMSLLTTLVDPKQIEILLSPTKAADVYGETKKGTWVDQTVAFPVVENTGEVSAYGDWNEDGRSDFNANWPQRQAALWQTITEWGDLEVERYGLARIDAIARKNISSANTLNRMANLVYFYGWTGLQNYGGLNDPGLSAALTPATKLAGGTGWINALPTEILADIQACYFALQSQTTGTGGNLELTDKMTLALHPQSETYLANTNSFGLTAMEMIRKVFPGLTVKTAVQYLSGTTYSLQLIVDEIEGQRTMECAFNEKMRAHRVIPAMSSFRQKKTAGAWGTIVYRPNAVALMSGI